MNPVVAIDLSCLEIEPATGVERYARTLAESLGPVADGLLPVGILRPGTALPEVTAPMKIEVANSVLPRAVWRETALVNTLRRLRAAVLHAPVVALPFRARCKLVVSVQEVPPTDGPEPVGRLSRHRLRLAQALRTADRFIVPTAVTARALVALAPAVAPKIRIIPHGVDLDFCPDGLPFDLARHRIPRAPYLLHVGTLRRRKDPMTLIRAFAEVAAEPGFESLQLVFAGKGEFPAEARDALSAIPAIAGRVHSLGYVSREELPGLYRSAALVVLPSAHEGFGIPAVEAMASGVPLVTSSDQALSEVTGDAAATFPTGDARALSAVIARLLLSGEERTELRRRALQRAEQFQWKRSAELHVQVYRELLAEAPRPAQ